MEIIPVTPNMLFLLETASGLPERQQEELQKTWNQLFPLNKLLIVKSGALKILDVKTF